MPNQCSQPWRPRAGRPRRSGAACLGELNGKTRLIRVSAAGAHTSLGELSDETQRLYDRFKARKEPLEARVVALKKQMEVHERLNRALRLGRVPNIVVATLKALQERDLSNTSLWSEPMRFTRMKRPAECESAVTRWPRRTSTSSLTRTNESASCPG